MGTAELAWHAARDGCYLSTAALLCAALPTLRPDHDKPEPYRHLRSTSPAGADITAAVDGGNVHLEVTGLPHDDMRRICLAAQVYFAPFTVETSLGRTPTPGKYTERARHARQHLTVRTDTADVRLKLPVKTASSVLNTLRSP
ncbi:hypothetical protein [Streptomyces sp. NBC_00239]|uniref:hypothetical protein n=1 Tax=Streptomyces sp. NBC_00239 TaxID=2903640 RepID=UPI002E2C0FB6|nr:hypothetical protein [Streptomyces sp. NBC_00239]